MKNFIQDGKILDLVLAAVVVSGAPVLQGSIFGIAQKSGGVGDTVACATEGVFELPYGVAAVVAAGDTIYWDNTAKTVTKTASANTKVGHAVAPAASAAATLKVKLIPAA